MYRVAEVMLQRMEWINLVFTTSYFKNALKNTF